MSDDVARRLERGKCPTCNSTVVIIAPEREGATGFMLPANEPDHTRALIERDRYREALEEIADHPWHDNDRDEERGCYDIHEARAIARNALKGTDPGEGDRSA